MSDILTGEVFADGETVTGARLNNAVNNAEIQPDFVDSKAAATPISADTLVYRQTSSGLLKKTTVSDLNQAGGNVTSVGLALPADFAVSGSPVTGAGTLTAVWNDQFDNRFLASPADGSTAVPHFRKIAARDLRLGTNDVLATQIDWSLSNNFEKAVSGSITFTFINHVNGMVIRVLVHHNGFAVHWPVVAWPSGIEPSPSVGDSIFRFMYIGATIYGVLEATNLHT